MPRILLHPAWRYTRIEPEAGGAARLDIPAYNAGLIDKGPDARGEYGAAEKYGEGAPTTRDK